MLQSIHHVLARTLSLGIVGKLSVMHQSMIIPLQNVLLNGNVETTWVSLRNSISLIVSMECVLVLQDWDSVEVPLKIPLVCVTHKIQLFG